MAFSVIPPASRSSPAAESCPKCHRHPSQTTPTRTTATGRRNSQANPSRHVPLANAVRWSLSKFSNRSWSSPQLPTPHDQPSFVPPSSRPVCRDQAPPKVLHIPPSDSPPNPRSLSATLPEATHCLPAATHTLAVFPSVFLLHNHHRDSISIAVGRPGAV